MKDFLQAMAELWPGVTSAPVLYADETPEEFGLPAAVIIHEGEIADPSFEAYNYIPRVQFMMFAEGRTATRDLASRVTALYDTAEVTIGANTFPVIQTEEGVQMSPVGPRTPSGKRPWMATVSYECTALSYG